MRLQIGDCGNAQDVSAFGGQMRKNRKWLRNSGKRNAELGFTLVELLIVLLIIGVLSGVTLRAIDMTRERTLFSDTAKKMENLAKAIAGNPDLIADGKRIDFGFIGDMGRLPLTLDELVKNITNSPNWNGPYIKLDFLEDTINPNFKRDAWNQEIEYVREIGLLRSRGNGRQTLSYKIADSVDFLLRNKVSGHITDTKNNPPGSYYTYIDIEIELPSGITPLPVRNPNKSGFFQFDSVPIGNHRLRVIRRTASPETLVKWISVVPKSNTFVDFTFSRSFQSKLQYVEGSGKTIPGDPSSVAFQLFNDAGENVTLDWLQFTNITRWDSVYRVFCGKITAQNAPTNPIFEDSTPRRGNGGRCDFRTSLNIPPSGYEIFTLYNFRNDSIMPGAPTVPMDSVTLKILFSDNSVIQFTTPKIW